MIALDFGVSATGEKRRQAITFDGLLHSDMKSCLGA